MSDHYPARWVTKTEANRPGPITLPILTEQLRTPLEAARLAGDVEALRTVFANRNLDRDRPLIGALTDLAAGIREHRRDLERWADRVAEEFAAQLEDGPA